MNAGDRSPTRRPFWLHQLVEYIVGMVLISQGLQLREPVTLTVGGIAVLVNAAVVSGPLSAFRWMPRPVHRHCDIALAGLLAAVGLQPLWGIDATSRGLLVVVAAVMFMLWRVTDYRAPQPRSPRSVASRSDAAPKRSMRPERPSPERIGRAAGKAAGGLVRRWRQQGSQDSRP